MCGEGVGRVGRKRLVVGGVGVAVWVAVWGCCMGLLYGSLCVVLFVIYFSWYRTSFYILFLVGVISYIRDRYINIRDVTGKEHRNEIYVYTTSET